MSGTGFDIGLDDPGQAGVYFVTDDDIATLQMAAVDAQLAAAASTCTAAATRPR